MEYGYRSLFFHLSEHNIINTEIKPGYLRQALMGQSWSWSSQPVCVAFSVLVCSVYVVVCSVCSVYQYIVVCIGVLRSV